MKELLIGQKVMEATESEFETLSKFLNITEVVQNISTMEDLNKADVIEINHNIKKDELITLMGNIEKYGDVSLRLTVINIKAALSAYNMMYERLEQDNVITRTYEDNITSLVERLFNTKVKTTIDLSDKIAVHEHLNKDGVEYYIHGKYLHTSRNMENIKRIIQDEKLSVIRADYKKKIYTVEI